MNRRKLERDLVQVIEGCRAIGVPATDFDDLVDMVVAHGEYGVAFEILTTQLAEYEVVIPKSVHERIVELGTALGIEPHYWSAITSTELPIAIVRSPR